MLFALGSLEPHGHGTLDRIEYGLADVVDDKDWRLYEDIAPDEADALEAARQALISAAAEFGVAYKRNREKI